MLEVGNGKLTEAENKAHFSLWCMMAAPLMLGNDIRKFVDGNNNCVDGNSTLKIVTNRQLIAIDQDPLGKAAHRIQRSLSTDVLVRPLANGDAALCILNKGAKSKNISFDINTLRDNEYLDLAGAKGFEIHDLWTDERTVSDTASAVIQKHGVAVYRIKPLH